MRGRPAVQDTGLISRRSRIRIPPPLPEKRTDGAGPIVGLPVGVLQYSARQAPASKSR